MFIVIINLERLNRYFLITYSNIKKYKETKLYKKPQKYNSKRVQGRRW